MFGHRLLRLWAAFYGSQCIENKAHGNGTGNGKTEEKEPPFHFATFAEAQVLV